MRTRLDPDTDFADMIVVDPLFRNLGLITTCLSFPYPPLALKVNPGKLLLLARFAVVDQREIFADMLNSHITTILF